MFLGISENGIVYGHTLGIDRTTGIGCGIHFLTLFLAYSRKEEDVYLIIGEYATGFV